MSTHTIKIMHTFQIYTQDKQFLTISNHLVTIKKKTNDDLHKKQFTWKPYFCNRFCLRFSAVFFALPAAAAQERTLNKRVFVWNVLQILHVGRFRAEPNSTSNHTNINPKSATKSDDDEERRFP